MKVGDRSEVATGTQVLLLMGTLARAAVGGCKSSRGVHTHIYICGYMRNSSSLV